MPVSEVILRVVLLVGGAAAVFTGFDFAAGGMRSLGLEGPVLSLTANDPHAFDVRDSHARFLGGVWLTVGLVFLASAARLRALKVALLASTVMIFIGGVARFSTGVPQTLFDPQSSAHSRPSSSACPSYSIGFGIRAARDTFTCS